MQRCIDLARIGRGDVAPNPMVGSVIVFEDKIIGEGYHQFYGKEHAEVNAINNVKDKSLLNKSTIYVSLEPCAHFGKTPPCADLIIKNSFKRVVIGCSDSFAEVSGKGVQKLKDAGIDVKIGVLDKECRDLNKRFFTFHEKKRPYIVLKWAQTKDGFIDKKRKDSIQKINWISSPETKLLVHKWRSEEQGILVGKNTVLKDDPTLTVREMSGKNPVRIILDSQLSIDSSAKVFNYESKTIIFNLLKEDKIDNLEWIKLQNLEVQTILDALYKNNIQSVFVEGGSSTLQSFIDRNLWDEARVIVGETIFEEGVIAPIISKIPTSNFDFSNDTIYIYLNV